MSGPYLTDMPFRTRESYITQQWPDPPEPKPKKVKKKKKSKKRAKQKGEGK